MAARIGIVRGGTRKSFFPPLMPDELLYSALARFAFSVQLVSDDATFDLFGRRLVRFSYDLPPNVADLVPLTPGKDAHDLLFGHTLLPFYTALMSPQQTRKVMSGVLANQQMIRNIIGPQARVPRPTRLRFCPDCEAEQVRDHGFAFWTRRHQLPTSLVCVRHRRPLLASGVSLHPNRVPRLERAGTWGSDRPALLPTLPGARLDRFIMLAQRGYHYLDWTGEAAAPFPLSLRQDALDAGFVWSKSRGKKIDQQGLRTAFETRDCEVVKLWPWLNEDDRGILNWIITHTLRTPKNRTTFTHAVLSTFLEACGKWAVLPPSPADDAWRGIHTEPRLIDFGRAARTMSSGDLLAEARAVIANIIDERPVVRATKSEILRRSNLLHRALRIGVHDDLSTKLERLVEDVPAFQLRRVTDIIRTAHGAGEALTITDIRVRSGIPDFDLLHRLVRAAATGPLAAALSERATMLVSGVEVP